MTAADTPTAARLDAEGWQVIYESEKCVIYMRTMQGPGMPGPRV